MVIAAAGITAAATIGSAALSSSSKGGGNATTTTARQDSTHLPWAPQGNAIEAGLADQQTIYNQRTIDGPYTGALYAPQNAVQQAAGAYAGASAAGQGYNGANTAYGMGAQGGNNIADASQSAQHIAAGGIGEQNPALTGALTDYGSGQKSVVQQPLSDTLHASATAGAKQIGGFNAGLQGVMDNAQSDPTQQLAADAGTYMNSAPIDARIKSVNDQIDATLNEQTVPGLNRAAAMGGNLNSSRAGMAEALANRDAALAKGNADSQIVNNAWNTGLTTAAGQHSAGLNTAASAGSAGLTGNSNLAIGTGNQDISGAQTQIGAANSGLTQQTAHQTADTSARLGADQNLLSGASTALNADTVGQSLATGNAKMLYDAGQTFQNDQQSQINADYNKWKLQNEYGQGVLNDYMTNVTKPSGYYMASQASTSTNTPPSSIGTLLAGTGTAIASQAAPGGIFSKTNKDGSVNQNYIGDWFSGNSNPNNTAADATNTNTTSGQYLGGALYNDPSGGY